MVAQKPLEIPPGQLRLDDDRVRSLERLDRAAVKFPVVEQPAIHEMTRPLQRIERVFGRVNHPEKRGGRKNPEAELPVGIGACDDENAGPSEGAVRFRGPEVGEANRQVHIESPPEIHRGFVCG